MKGWFDLFRDDGGPTWYSYSNRTPVTGDVSLIIIFVVFCTLLLAFLIIFPGIRKERLTTFLTVTLIIFVGTSILVAQYGSTWHTSTTKIRSSYSAFSKQRMPAEIGGYIGLMHINITYKLLPGGTEDVGDFEYNERFWWRTSTEMTQLFKEALRRGTPFPIISLAEYFSVNQEGFSWGSKYREAGYYASIMLWISFASWAMMNLLLIVVPRYGAISMIFTGFCMLSTNLVYWSLLPLEPLVAHVDGSILTFDFGWNYWLVFVAGITCTIIGVCITAYDLMFPHSFSTILELDYDTPYDRHVIIEDSTNTSRKKSLIDGAGASGGAGVGRRRESFNNRFIRRVSSKLSSSRGNSGPPTSPPAIPDHRGVVNRGYVPHTNDIHEQSSKPPGGNNWSYPFQPMSRRVI